MESARQQRRAMSLPEVKLWAVLRRSPQSVRFRRQHPIGPYVADFYCAAARLVIEIDGMIHDQPDRARKDIDRDAFIRSLGREIIRVAAADVLTDPETVADGLVRLCKARIGPSTTPPGRSPG